MKKQITVLLVAAAIFCVSTANAQFQLSANGAYLKGTGDNDAHLWGGGLTGKFFLGNTIALGAGFNTFPKTTTNNIGNTNYSYTNANTQVFGTLDVMLGGNKNGFQPYIGGNVGASINSHSYYLSSDNTVSTSTTNDKTYFYVAPKIGFNLAFSPMFGVFAQGSYGLTFGSGNNNDVSIPNSTAKPVDKFFQVDAGVYIRLSGAK